MADFIGPAEAGRILGMAEGVVILFAERGRIPGRLRGGRWLFAQRTIESLAESQGVVGGIRTTPAVSQEEPDPWRESS